MTIASLTDPTMDPDSAPVAPSPVNLPPPLPGGQSESHRSQRLAKWQGTGSNDVTTRSTETDDGTGTFTMVSSARGRLTTPLRLAVPAEVVTPCVPTGTPMLASISRTKQPLKEADIQ